MVALIWVGSILAYMAIATIVGIKAYWAYTDSEARRGSSIGDAPFSATVTAVCWPLGIWLLIGLAVITAGELRRKRHTEMNAEREILLAQARKELQL